MTHLHCRQDPDARKELMLKLHKRKTALFMDMVASGAMPLRPGVRRLVGMPWDGGGVVVVGTVAMTAKGMLSVLVVAVLFAVTIVVVMAALMMVWLMMMFVIRQVPAIVKMSAAGFEAMSVLMMVLLVRVLVMVILMLVILIEAMTVTMVAIMIKTVIVPMVVTPVAKVMAVISWL